MFASALVSALLKDVAGSIIKCLFGIEEDDIKDKNMAVIYSVILLLIYIFFYVILCYFTVKIYAGIRAGEEKANADIIFSNMFDKYFLSNLPSFIVVPLAVGIIKWLLNSHKNGFTFGIKLIAAISGSVFLIFSPHLINPGRVSDFPMESEILTELRTMSFPFEDRIFNPIHLQIHFSNGYWTGDNPRPLNECDEEDTTQQEIQKPTKDIRQMTFAELIDAVRYYSYYSYDYEMLRQYLDVAYDMYQIMGADKINDWNSIGCMFFYLGFYENTEYYWNGVDAFLQDDEYENALYCYRDLFNDYYEIKNTDSRLSDVAGKMMELYKTIIENRIDEAYGTGLIEDVYIKTFDEGYNSLSNRLEELCNAGIDSPLLNTLNIVSHVGDGKYEDWEKLDGLAKDRKYFNCPKVAILRDIYRFHNNENYTVEPLYKLYTAYPQYFEHEDRVNLVWLLYERGQYIRTYEVSASLLADAETVSDNGTGTDDFSSTDKSADQIKAESMNDKDEAEASKDISDSSLEYQMLLIKAESYLQDSGALSEVDENKLYKDITDALKDLGVKINAPALDESGDDFGTDSYDGDTMESEKKSSDEVEAVPIQIKDEITARLRLAQCILAGRIGIDTSYAGLSEICEELFNTDSKTGLYIIASLSHQDGDERRTITLCNQIVEMIDIQDNFQSRVLLLKADALIALATRADASEEQRNSYYSEAEDILVTLRNMALNDYIASSQRLVEVYEATGRYDEAQEIEEDLMRFK